MAAERTLRDLVNKALDRHNATSGSELARIAQDNGYTIVYTTINHIRAGTYRSRPGKETLKALAWLAGVPLREAYSAAELPQPGRPFAEDLPPNADLMSQEERDVVNRMIRVILKRYEEDPDPPVGLADQSPDGGAEGSSGTRGTTNGQVDNENVTLELRKRES